MILDILFLYGFACLAVASIPCHPDIDKTAFYIHSLLNILDTNIKWGGGGGFLGAYCATLISSFMQICILSNAIFVGKTLVQDLLHEFLFPSSKLIMQVTVQEGPNSMANYVPK